MSSEDHERPLSNDPIENFNNVSKRLKRIINTDIADLSGCDKMIKSLIDGSAFYQKPTRLTGKSKIKIIDAKLVAARFFKKAEENKRTEQNEPVPLLSFGDVKLFKHNDADTDRQFFINLFLKRGKNKLTEIIEEVDPERAAVIKHKAKAYGILMEYNKNDLKHDPNYLTLLHISTAFPVETVNMILRKQIPGILKSGSQLFLSPLPILLQHTIFFHVIPHHTFAKEFKDIAIILNIDIIQFLPAEKKKIFQSKLLNELLYSSENIIGEIMKISVLEEHVRVEMMVEAGLLELDQTDSETGSGSEAQEKKYKPTAVAMGLINQLPNIKRLKFSSFKEAIAKIQAIK